MTSPLQAPADRQDSAAPEQPPRLDPHEHLTLRLALSEKGRTEVLLRLAQIEHRAAAEQAERVLATLGQKYGDCRIEEDGRLTRQST